MAAPGCRASEEGGGCASLRCFFVSEGGKRWCWKGAAANVLLADVFRPGQLSSEDYVGKFTKKEYFHFPSTPLCCHIFDTTRVKCLFSHSLAKFFLYCQNAAPHHYVFFPASTQKQSWNNRHGTAMQNRQKRAAAKRRKPFQHDA